MRQVNTVTAVLIISTAGVLFFGLYIMHQLNNFIESGGFADSVQTRAKQAVLLFGDAEIVKVVAECLSSYGITWQDTPTIIIPEETSFFAAVAVSRNDLDNLTICRRAKRLWPDVMLFAWCNNSTYQFLYTDAGVKNVSTGTPDTPSILLAIER